MDVDEPGNDETARLVRETGGTATSYKCDVSARDQIQILHERIKKDTGPVDLLINNAGIVWGHPFIDHTKDQFIVDQINVNLMGQIWVSVWTFFFFFLQKNVPFSNFLISIPKYYVRFCKFKIIIITIILRATP